MCIKLLPTGTAVLETLFTALKKTAECLFFSLLALGLFLEATEVQVNDKNRQKVNFILNIDTCGNIKSRETTMSKSVYLSVSS